MRDLLQDLQYGLRAFKRNPTFTLVALLALALGIGPTTAIPISVLTESYPSA